MRVWTLAILSVRLAVAPVEPGAVHPLHTSLTQLTYAAGDRAVQISIRAFAEDFHAAVERYLGSRAPVAGNGLDSVAFAYVTAAFALLDRGGSRLPLAWCGLKRAGDLVWVCLQAPAPGGGGLAGLQVDNRVFFDLFDDQINIMQATYEGRRETLLFTQDDHSKHLR